MMRFSEKEYARVREANADREELQEAQEEIARLRTALAEAQRENEELREDRERLDFIITGCTGLTFADDNIADVFFETVAQHEDMRIGFRAAFDAAIREARRGE